MSTFVIKKRIPLDFLGEGWKEAYVEFSPFSFVDNDKIIAMRKFGLDQNGDNAKEASDQLLEVVKEKFIEGKGWNGEKLINITKENLAELPIEVIVKVLQELQGNSILPKN